MPATTLDPPTTDPAGNHNNQHRPLFFPFFSSSHSNSSNPPATTRCRVDRPSRSPFKTPGGRQGFDFLESCEKDKV
ncbi:hypothetical protein PHLCEN_2v3186 [Hermanssonia centrifuga]|uniref:Uncharacterized protein n=1 Tax=Hermanssonia centrifuga TaxID=98765 RepID=A0A2R6R0Y0_9APHY|nr:hypothetical protein PHLCEN_2v3186 [Hermanssonia centrifuga]